MMDTEDEHEYQELKTRILRAIIANDMKVFCMDVYPDGGQTPASRDRLKKLLLEKQRFPRLGPDYDPHMSRILMNVLVTPCSLRPVAQNPNRGVTDDDDLDACLKRYRGHLLHIAAALGRTGMVMKMLDVVAGFDWVEAGCSLIEAKDSEDHTALVVAVLAQSREMVGELVYYIKANTHVENRETMIREFRNAVEKSTFHLHQKPIQDMVQLLLHSVESIGCIKTINKCLYLPICLEDVRLLLKNIKARFRQQLPNEISRSERRLLTIENGPSALHFAVWRYSDRHLDENRKSLLNCLMKHGGRQRAELHEVCQMYADHDLLISGTPVHFATYRLSILVTEIGKVTPPLREPEPCWPSQEDPPQETSKARASNTDSSELTAAGPEDHSEPVSKEPEADSMQSDPSTEGGSTESNKPGEDGSKQVNEKKKEAPKSGKDSPAAASPVQLADDSNVDGILEILDMLHENEADFGKVNREGKTALDLLPSNADPQVVKKLVDYMRAQLDKAARKLKRERGEYDLHA